MRRSHWLAKTSLGDAQGGLGPSCGGSRLQRRCQRSLLARDVPSGVGGTRPPRLAPGGGNGKGGDQYLPRCRRLINLRGVTEYRCS
jgi:hypothetical protein